MVVSPWWLVRREALVGESPPPSERLARPWSAPGAAAPAVGCARTTSGPRRSRRPPSWSPTLGGTGVAIPVDHLDPQQVSELAERLRVEHGHVDVLVNNVWGAERLKGGPADWNTPIWQHDLDKGLAHRASRCGDPPDHVPPPPAARGRSARRPARRSDRWNRRVQRHAVPDLGVLRLGQGRREPVGVLTRPRAGAVSAGPRWRSPRAGCARR